MTIHDQLIKLEKVAVAAIAYVGQANYDRREKWAISEYRRAMQALRENRSDDIVFRQDTQHAAH